MRMRIDKLSSGKRKAVNLSLDTGVVEAAREAGLNLSQVCEAALATASKAERERRWKEENRAAIDELNAWLDQNGMPLSHLREL